MYYYVSNGHGDIEYVTDNTGEVVTGYTYTAFGIMSYFVDNVYDINPFTYCGEYFDTVSGQYYLRARWYNANIGRFTTVDPAKDGMNLYVYCASNPIMNVDPSGKVTEEDKKKLDDGEISQYTYDLLVKLGEQWEAAETQASKDEIHAKAEAFRAQGYTAEDCTNRANYQLKLNAEYINSLGINAPKEWYELVKSGGDWDYKSLNNENKPEWMPDSDIFIYDGYIISIADFGNINFGYTGKALGLPDEVIYSGGGYAAHKYNGDSTGFSDGFYGDSENDFYMITKGITKAKNDGWKTYRPQLYIV